MKEREGVCYQAEKKNDVNNFITFFTIYCIIHCVGCFSAIVTNTENAGCLKEVSCPCL